jgi:glutathione S-transferase
VLELYHHLISTCSQKVRLVLAEKGLEFESHEVDLVAGEQHDPEYVKLNPNHVVPTLIDDGRILIESTLINEYLDDAYPTVAVRPTEWAERHAMRMWTKRIDDKVHPYAGVVTYAIGARPMVLQRTPEEIEASIAAIPDPHRRAARRSVIDHGVKSPEFAPAIAAFVALLDDMEAALESSDWLAGDAISLADCAVLPYLIRLDHLAMAPLLAADVRPRVADWYARFQQRPSFATAVTDWAPEALVSVFQKNGAEVWADVEPLTRLS